jgi:hypothetical protein
MRLTRIAMGLVIMFFAFLGFIRSWSEAVGGAEKAGAVFAFAFFIWLGWWVINRRPGQRVE